MLPDIDSLRCFEAAARLLNFRAAAACVHLSPAAFGERIKRLEQDLDAPLFERTTRQVTLTQAGIRLLPAATRLLQEAAHLTQIVHAGDAPRRIELVLGTRYELGLSWLVPSLTPLSRSRPERKLHLFFGDSADLLARLRSGSVDALVSSTRLTVAGLAYVPLHQERYVFVGAAPLLARTPLRRATDAREHVLLDVTADLPLFRYFLDATSTEEVWAFREVERLGTIAAIRARALEGAGVAVLPRDFVRQDLLRGRLVALFPRRKLQVDTFRLVWLEEHPESDELRRLAEDLLRLPFALKPNPR